MNGIALLALLCPLAAAAAPPPLMEMLNRTGKAVATFWDQFSSVNCTETVSQLKLDKNGKTVLRQESVFDYLVMLRLADDDLTVEESRVKVKAAAAKAKAPLLVTNGFSTLLLIFHPYYQGSYEFAPPGEEDLDGRPALRVDFRQLRNARSPSCLRLRGRDYPLAWSGSAWIDPESGAVLRMKAVLATSMEDVGLKSLSAEVRYAPVQFRDSAESWRLPAEAVIEAETPLQHWRNIHRFTNYKHFSVNTREQAEAPK